MVFEMVYSMAGRLEGPMAARLEPWTATGTAVHLDGLMANPMAVHLEDLMVSAMEKYSVSMLVAMTEPYSGRTKEGLSETWMDLRMATQMGRSSVPTMGCWTEQMSGLP